MLVEFESPTDKPFTKNRTPSASLAKGLSQLDEWEIWTNKNDGLFRDRLSKYLLACHIPAQCSNASDHLWAHTEVRDPRTVIHHDFVVVVGRRGNFDQDAQERRGVYYDHQRIIASYDRILDAAKRIDWENA